MISLSSDHVFEYMVASGALAFDGKGWPWERPLVWSGLIKPELFTVVIKTLTRQPREGNYRWWKPWECTRLIQGGSVNKIGLTNGGIEWWMKEIAPTIDFKKYHIVGSIYGNKKELMQMASLLNRFDLVALEVNPSCPNTGNAMPIAEEVVSGVKIAKHFSRHPIIVKVSVVQDYLAIAEGLKGIAEAISLNAVPWEVVFPRQRSPLWRLEKKIGGGGGGVSGKPAQKFNWAAARALRNQRALPVIVPGVMDYEDFIRTKKRFDAVSFGAIHFRTPWAPTSFVEREMKETKEREEL